MGFGKGQCNGSLLDTFKTLDNDILISDLDDDTEYTIYVRAYDEAGNKSVRLTGVFSTSVIGD